MPQASTIDFRHLGLIGWQQAYELQDKGFDTVDAQTELGLPIDAREYAAGAAILADLGLEAVRLLTNNPRKMESAVAFGLTVVEEVPIEVPPNAENLRYLQAKREKLGHRLHHQDLKFEPDPE